MLCKISEAGFKINHNILLFKVTTVFLILGLSGISCSSGSETIPSKKENVQDEAHMKKEKQKILIAYFSHTGNTREIANQIHKTVSGDIFEIQSADPYPEDYNTVVEQAREELESDYRPPLKKQVENLESYDMIYLGYPIWWGTYPMAVKTFLSENDFSGKTITPFCTHGGSALGRSVTDLKKICPNSTVLTGLAITGTTAKNAQDKVSEWLKDIKLK